MAKFAPKKFLNLPQAESCRLVDYEKKIIVPGFVTNTWILIVKGTKPWLNMEVKLWPRIYVQKPEYWGIEVVGCLPGGIGLPTEGTYEAHIPLEGITGTKGIEVISPKGGQKMAVPPKK